MKNIGLFGIPLALIIAVLTLVNSCVQLKSNSNPNDPTSANYKAPASNVQASGWKIDSAGGLGGTPCLRCVNVPVGQSRVISFAFGQFTSALPTFPSKEGTNDMKSSSVASGLTYTVMISNQNGNNEKAVWGGNVGNFGSFSTVFATLTATPTYTGAFPNSVTCYVIISNISDSDGTNVVWFDNTRFGWTSGSFTAVPFDYNSLANSGLTGDKEQ